MVTHWQKSKQGLKSKQGSKPPAADALHRSERGQAARLDDDERLKLDGVLADTLGVCRLRLNVMLSFVPCVPCGGICGCGQLQLHKATGALDREIVLGVMWLEGTALATWLG